jgi:hypothetical protein
MEAVIERACFDCGEPKHVLVGMEPGHDGVPWWLCGTCLRAPKLAAAQPSLPHRTAGARPAPRRQAVERDAQVSLGGMGRP